MGAHVQGGYCGILEFSAQSNESANSVHKDSRFKFVDNLTVLEKINILIIGLTSFNTKLRIPNDINESNLFIPNKNLKTQTILDQIQEWTTNQKMELNEQKTKKKHAFQLYKNKQFSTRITLKNKVIESVKET